MDILQLIEEIEDIIDQAGSVPLTKKVMVDADEISEILNEMRSKLPDAIREATVITEDRQGILDEAKRTAEQTRQAALADADRILAKSEQNARNVTLQATTYIDDMFASTQDRLKEMLSAIESSRNELRRSK